jgi:hypothetical protein
MLRFVARHGLVRVIGGRAVPVLLAWDVLVLANRTRQLPVVDRNLRRVAGVAKQRIGSAAAGLPVPTRPSRASRPWRSRRSGTAGSEGVAD